MQVDVDERAYRVHRRLSGAALRALLAATPHPDQVEQVMAALPSVMLSAVMDALGDR